MGRKSNQVEERRELIEADLGRLGTAIVLAQLVMNRIDAVAAHGMGSMLLPGRADLEKMVKLIRETQVKIESRG